MQQRIGNLELVVASFCDSGGWEHGVLQTEPGWSPWQSAVPGDALANECAAAKSIQRAWKLSRAVAFAKQDIAARAACKGNGGSGSASLYDPAVGEELDRLLDELINEAALRNCLMPKAVCSSAMLAASPNFQIGVEIVTPCWNSIGDTSSGASLVPQIGNEQSEMEGRLSFESQMRLRELMDRTIAAQATIADFTFVYDVAEVRAKSNAFFTIASYLPDWETDDLGNQLKIIKRMREGITAPSHCEVDACRLETKFGTIGLADLCADAGFFYQAIGELDDDF